MDSTSGKVFRTGKFSAFALVAVTATVLHFRDPKPAPGNPIIKNEPVKVSDPKSVPGAPVIENERVKVWDITLNPGQPTPMQHHDLDFVTSYLAGGKIRITTADGKSHIETHDFGDSVFTKSGTDQKEEVLSGSTARVIVTELKDHPEPPYPNNSGYPPSFPRHNATKTFENDRVVCWRYNWTIGEKPLVHFHDKDLVVAYRYTGTLSSTTLDGKVVTSDYEFGSVRFNRGNRTHSEDLVKGQESGFMVELK